MPSIALFIKELLAEDPYSPNFSSKLEERVQELNAAQLLGMYNHLKATADSAHSKMWSKANIEIINKIEDLLQEKTKQAEKEQKLIEEYNLKQMQKKKKAIEAEHEQRRVMHMIADKARSTAQKEVKDEEAKRQSDERIEIMHKVFKGEERRNKWWIRIGIFFVVAVIAVAVVVNDLLILIACIGGIAIICVALAYRAHLFTVVLPKRMSEDELEQEIHLREEVLKKKAVSTLREKERKFQEQLIKDKIERKKDKMLRKQKQEFEAELMEKRRLEHIAMASEIMKKQEMLKNEINNNSENKINKNNNDIENQHDVENSVEIFSIDDSEYLEMPALSNFENDINYNEIDNNPDKNYLHTHKMKLEEIT